MNKKIFLSVGLVIVFIILVVVGYFALMRSKELSSQPKSDSGIYIDKQLGFSIIPPKGWHIDKKEMPGSIAFFEKDGGQIVNKQFNPTLAITSWPDEKLSLEKHVERIKKMYSESFESNKIVSDIVAIIDGKEARIIESNITNTVTYNTPKENCENCKFQLKKLDVVLASGVGKIYYITGVAPETNWGVYKELITNSQKTFRLIAEQNVLGPAIGMLSFAQISACKDWMGLDKMDYLGCLPKSSETKLTIRNNLNNDIRMNFENLSTGSLADTFFSHQEKTIDLGNKNKEVPVRISTVDNKIISDKQQLDLILWKLE